MLLRGPFSGPRCGGVSRLAIPAGKCGFKRLKSEGFQTLLSDSILACGIGEKRGLNWPFYALFRRRFLTSLGDVSNICDYYLCIYMKSIALLKILRYYNFEFRGYFPPFQFSKGLPMMRLVVRAFAICLVLSGAAAVSLSSSAVRSVASHQAATSSLPVPLCGPWVPCPPDPVPPSGGIR